MCYSLHYVEGTAQQEDSDTVRKMECVTVNIMWKILHSRWTVVLQVEWCVTVNIMWKVQYSRWRVILQVEWSVLQ